MCMSSKISVGCFFFFLKEPGIQNSRLVVDLEGLGYKGVDNVSVQCAIYKNNF